MLNPHHSTPMDGRVSHIGCLIFGLTKGSMAPKYCAQGEIKSLELLLHSQLKGLDAGIKIFPNRPKSRLELLTAI